MFYALMRLQGFLPLNPAGHVGRSAGPDLQHGGQLRHQHQLAELRRREHAELSHPDGRPHHQNFVSAATGIALAVALIRGFARASAKTVGNFWVDLTRCTLYVLLPLSIIAALFLVWQGVPQNLGAYVDATTLEGAKQTIASGPVASQIAIKQLGTNGGGFFNANSAHPFENPTPLIELRRDDLHLRSSAPR